MLNWVALNGTLTTLNIDQPFNVTVTVFTVKLRVIPMLSVTVTVLEHWRCLAGGPAPCEDGDCSHAGTVSPAHL